MLHAPVLRAIPPGEVNSEICVRIELGKAQLPLSELGKFRESILLLDRNASDPVDLVVGDRTIARGELMLMNEVLCVRVTEILAEEHVA